MEGFERSSNEPAQGAKLHIRASKFLAPASLPGQLERSALLAQLAQRESARLILINAGAGYGKTALLQQYRERCLAEGRQVLWCNLDAADNDVARLVSVLYTGLRDLGLIADSAGAPSSDDAAQAQQWLLEHVAAVNESFAVLLDEFEAINNPAAMDFFQHLLKALPAPRHGRHCDAHHTADQSGPSTRPRRIAGNRHRSIALEPR